MRARVTNDRRTIVANETSGQKKVAQGRGFITPEDMSRVTEADFLEIGELARRYCRVVDSTRSRKRANRCATVVKSGRAPYGTDDVSDDVTQDSIFLFARRLNDIVTSCDVSAVWVETGEPCAWQYVRKDGWVIVVTRNTMQRWAVRDAAARNGYRLDVKPEEMDSVPGAQAMRGMPHATTLPALAVTPYLADYGPEIFRSAWGDGSEYPTLKRIMGIANSADDLGRAGILETAAQEIHGGQRGSRRPVRRTRDTARREWRDLKEGLDSARENLVYRSVQVHN